MQAIGRQPQRAPGGTPILYDRQRPDQTSLCRILECGIVGHGFLRLRCGERGHDKLLDFSWKRRGFCPSCGARRMSRTAAHLVDHVIPQVPVRQ